MVAKRARKVVKKKSTLMTRRKKNNPIKPAMQLGELHIIKRVPTKKGSSGGQRWRAECSCGVKITIPQWYLVRTEHPKRHCGCKAKEGVNPYPRERGIWYMMHRRCYNNTHVAYPHYGGATPPIGVCDEWNKDKVGVDAAWEAFMKDMGPAPSKKYTLDRIDPYKGYGWMPKDDGSGMYLNCRWATATEQMNNLKSHWTHPDDRKIKLAMEKFDVDIDGDDDDEDKDK